MSRGPRRRFAGALVACTAGVLLLQPGTRSEAATITIVNLDGSGEGFNDPTPKTPIGGNLGTTLGEQRLIAYQHAADIWGAILNSPVEIRVEANFSSLPCSGGGAVLGFAGPLGAFRDFAGVPRAGTWYHVALANRLAGLDLDPDENDIATEFNHRIDKGCLPGILGWYYGVDGDASPGSLDILPVLLHELAHGLGFSTFVNLGSGAKLFGLDDAYMVHLENHSTGSLFPDMTDAERAAASTNTGQLHWVGSNVLSSSEDILTAGIDSVSGHVEMYAPNPHQTGSSVSHFSNTLAPDELMEPSATANPMMELTTLLLKDLGWNRCGDGVVDDLEGCDDGARQGGDGCNESCEVEPCLTCVGEPSSCTPVPSGEPCDDGNPCTGPDACQAGNCAGAPDDGAFCDDGNPCTADACQSGTCMSQPDDGASCDDGNPCTESDTCSAGSCSGAAAPRLDCADSPSAVLVLRNNPRDARDRLIWLWTRGTEVDFGDPVDEDDLQICVFDTTGVQLARSVPQGERWTETNDGRKFRYLDKTLAAGGIKKILLKAAREESSEAKMVVIGKGGNLHLPQLSGLEAPVTIQLINGAACWETVFEQSDVVRNTDKKFKARAMR